MEPIYIVMIIILVIWTGIFSYMLHLEKEVKKIAQRLKKVENVEINDV